MFDTCRHRAATAARVATVFAALLGGCAGFAPQAGPGPEPDGRYVTLTTPILAVGDTQEHESTGYPLHDNDSAVDAYVEVAQRPPEQPLFGRRILEWALQAHPGEPFLHLGDVMDTMDDLDLWKDTMLIVTTDHGFMLGEDKPDARGEFRGCWAKNWQPWFDELAHIPLFIHDPRCLAPGQARCSLVQTIDLAPTLRDFFGLPATRDMLGRPLRDTGGLEDCPAGHLADRTDVRGGAQRVYASRMDCPGGASASGWPIGFKSFELQMRSPIRSRTVERVSKGVA